MKKQIKRKPRSLYAVLQISKEVRACYTDLGKEIKMPIEGIYGFLPVFINKREALKEVEGNESLVFELELV